MPNGDGTGPMGYGQSGRTSGFCKGERDAYAAGQGIGCGAGRRNRFGKGGRGQCRQAGWTGGECSSMLQNEKDFLAQRKEELQNQLNAVTERLNAFATQAGKEE
jgi:hypothetical protein